MHRDDLLSGIRINARLYGPREALRVLHAVLDALAATAPPGPMRELRAQVPPAPATVERHLAPHDLIGSVAGILGVDAPEAAFLARQVFAQLNVWCHGVTPAALAPDLPDRLTGLLTARPDEADRYARHLTAVSDGMPLLAPRSPAEAPDTTQPVDTQPVAAVVPPVRARPARRAYTERA